MQIYRNLDELSRFPRNARTHVTIGSFDGLHLGHQALIGATIQSARSMGGHSTVFTFANHPLSLLAPAYRPARIMSDETRIRLIEKLGADSLVLVTFDKVLADMSPEIFVLEVLVKKLHVHQIVTGFNFRFGKDGAGDEKVLAEIGREFGLSIQRLQPVEIDRVIVSSTKIRELLTQGLVALASRFLGRPHFVRGRVIRGLGRGRHLEYPTANLELTDRVLVPANGCYAVRVRFEGKLFGGMMNIGYNPTFPPEHFSLEVHLFDYAGDLVDQTLEVHFLKRLRLEQKFSTPEALMEQLRRDEHIARQFIATYPL
ncbi:MAG TPA: bifunctional riboflavin kinase/FAD synthetase [Candidatus Sumerlaeota bacterium]|nr:bifunctional riboflavin kinase/FAD synthetase [Candidatus Sumerlaeota bacterium]